MGGRLILCLLLGDRLMHTLHSRRLRVELIVSLLYANTKNNQTGVV